MAQRSGFFDSTYVIDDVNGFPRGDKAQDAAFFAKLHSMFFSNGIIKDDGDALRVTATGADGGKVTVGTGSCIINGYIAYDEAAEDFEVPFSEEAQAFVIVQRLDLTTPEGASITKQLVEHTADPVRTDTVHDIWLAVIQVPAGTVNIDQSMITDVRASQNVCGWSASPSAAVQAEAVPDNVVTGADVSLHLTRTAAYTLQRPATLAITAEQPEAGIYVSYSIAFASGESPTVLTVPEGWIFSGQDCVDGVFAPASGSNYEMVGAWHDGILRWVVLAW